MKLWNSLASSSRSLLAACKTALHNHYRSALATTFNPENISTWKSVCFKCHSICNKKILLMLLPSILTSFNEHCYFTITEEYVLYYINFIVWYYMLQNTNILTLSIIFLLSAVVLYIYICTMKANLYILELLSCSSCECTQHILWMVVIRFG